MNRKISHDIHNDTTFIITVSTVQCYFHKFSERIVTSNSRLPARNPRSAEIESSELGNKSFRYPSLHMFLQFTFARRLDFKMLISNSAIKRAGDQEKRNEKKNIRIYVYRAACHEEHLLLPIEKELE